MKNKLKYLFILLAFLTGLVISTVLYVQSFEFYQDEWGTDISFSSDYLIAIVITICGLVYSLISLITECKFRFVLLNLVLSPNFGNSFEYSLLNKLKNAFSESIVRSSPTILIVIISLSESLLSLILRLFLIFIGMISLYISSTIVKIIVNKSVKFSTFWI